uniref:Aquaporin n=1 Tax=Xiphophorus couchianus TaxID=32473 RepID=A0A3B5KX94_9TELE
MADLWVSLGVLAAAVLLCEATRRAAARFLPGVCWIYLLEAASTFQLCCCTQELKLLAESVRLDLSISLTLTYVVTVVHLSTFREATCNPAAALERACRGAASGRAAALLIAVQLGAAVAARSFAASVWSLGLSDMHRRHQKFGFRCIDPLGGTVLEAAAVELACAFAVQATAMHVHKAYLCAFVYFVPFFFCAGGSISGAIFNPALAFSVQFPCSGHTYLEYCFIYWLGPTLGMASCILLFEKIVPFLSGKGPAETDGSVAQKEKTQ